jgi:hypothetical protein
MGPSRWADVVEIVGPFLPGVLREGGEILSPMGAPNAVLFLARRPGRAAIDVVTGDPRHAPQTMPLERLPRRIGEILYARGYEPCGQSSHSHLPVLLTS